MSSLFLLHTHRIIQASRGVAKFFSPRIYYHCVQASAPVCRQTDISPCCCCISIMTCMFRRAPLNDDKCNRASLIIGGECQCHELMRHSVEYVPPGTVDPGSSLGAPEDSFVTLSFLVSFFSLVFNSDRSLDTKMSPLLSHHHLDSNFYRLHTLCQSIITLGRRARLCKQSAREGAEIASRKALSSKVRRRRMVRARQYFLMAPFPIPMHYAAVFISTK